jgi:hypothetical protein
MGTGPPRDFRHPLRPGLAFILALALPGAATGWRVMSGGEIATSEEENRRLATFAAIPTRMADGRIRIPTLPEAVDTAFEDQLTVRMALTRPLNSILVHLFGNSTAAEVAIGPRGHWFRTGAAPVFEILSCANPDGIEQESADRLVDAYLGFDERMTAQSVETALLIVPNKAAVYPEALPPELAERCANRPYFAESLAERLRAGGANAVFDLDWFRERNPDLIWDRRHYHFSESAGRLFIHDQMTTGALSFLGIEASPLEQLERRNIEDVDLDGRLGIYPQQFSTPLLRMQPEIENIRNGIAIRDEDGVNYAPLFSPGRLNALRIYYGSRETGRAIFVGDSFSQRSRDYFARNFAETLYARTNDMNRRLGPGSYDRLVEMFQPDVIVFMFEQAKFEPVIGSARARHWITAWEPDQEPPE